MEALFNENLCQVKLDWILNADTHTQIIFQKTKRVAKMTDPRPRLKSSCQGASISVVNGFMSAFWARDFLKRDEICRNKNIHETDGCASSRTQYKLVQSVADRSLNICTSHDPTKVIAKRSLQTMNCSVVFRGSVKGSQRAGV